MNLNWNIYKQRSTDEEKVSELIKEISKHYQELGILFNELSKYPFIINDNNDLK